MIIPQTCEVCNQENVIFQMCHNCFWFYLDLADLNPGDQAAYRERQEVAIQRWALFQTYDQDDIQDLKLYDYDFVISDAAKSVGAIGEAYLGE